MLSSEERLFPQPANVGMVIEEEQIPVRESVKRISELLGLDPLYLANEGKLIAICPGNESERLLEVMKSIPSVETPRPSEE